MLTVLIETRLNALHLNESKKPRKGCLGHLEGVCADYKNPTRNGRLYPLPLWEKVFNDSIFKESLENHTLFGELDHPEDRFEPLMSKACIVMTDYTIDEEKGLIYGGFDILDTPDGRILKSILDYGSVVGVSSRGQGDIIESADGEMVDENSYEFACFDVVSTPAVEKARQKVTESMKKKSFKESVQAQIRDAETLSDLNIIRSVVRSSNMVKSDMDTIVESIEDKCKSIQSSEETILQNDNDLQKSATMTVESAKTIRDNKKLYSCINNLRSKVSSYKHREQRYVESLNKRNDEIEDLKEQVEKLKSDNRQVTTRSRMRTEQLERVKEQSEIESQKLMRSKESLRQSKIANDNLASELSKLKESNSSKSEELIKVKRDLAEKERIIESMTKRIESLKNDESALEDKHESEINAIDDEVREYSRLLDEAREKLNSNSESITKLNELLEVEKGKNKSAKEAYQTLQDAYLHKVCLMNGLDYDHIKNVVGNSDSAKKIDSLVESRRRQLDKYNKLPFSTNGLSCGHDALIESIRKPTPDEIEDSRLDSFLESTQKSF